MRLRSRVVKWRFFANLDFGSDKPEDCTSDMFKQLALAIFCIGLVIGQVHDVQERLDDVNKVKCFVEVPKGFACAIFFSVDPPLPNGIEIGSVVPSDNNFVQPPPVIREISVILDGTLYTAAFDPALKRDGKFSGLRRNIGIPVSITAEDLVVKWPDGTEAKARIIRREKIDPNRPQRA